MLTQNKVYRHEEHDRGMLGDARFASWGCLVQKISTPPSRHGFTVAEYMIYSYQNIPSCELL
jgi:hypothetical protein